MRELQVTIDPWSYFDYKAAFGGGATGPSWVGNHWRRLRAYQLLESYCRNGAREWLSIGTDPVDKTGRREYGDPATIVDTILASVIGDDQSLVTPEAEGETPEATAQAQHDALLDWMNKERFTQKMLECERNSVKLGDGVYVLGWSEKKGRPRLRVYDPGFYFPVLDAPQDDDPFAELDDDGFPRKVHICYEFEQMERNVMTRYVRRITWELVELDGQIVYPWNDKPSSETCLYSDGVWRLGDATNAMDLDESQASWRARDIDLEIDFIPVVHVPNRVSEQEHFGTSALAVVMQVLDDLVATDTDLQAASSTTGSPPLVLSGSTAPRDDEGRLASYGPGSVLETGDGTATMIDTSRSLDALLKYDDHMLERLSVNGRIPESLLGRVKPNEVPSGIALTLSFAPHTNMIKEMRLVRKEKYNLLFRMVSRYLLLNGDIDEVHDSFLKFGSFLPADRSETSNIVQQLYTAKVISLQTAISLLVTAGYPIDDAQKELELIQSKDFDGANKLLDATGNPDNVAMYLGVKVDDNQGVPPDPTAPPALPPGPPTPPGA